MELFDAIKAIKDDSKLSERFLKGPLKVLKELGVKTKDLKITTSKPTHVPTGESEIYPVMRDKWCVSFCRNDWCIEVCIGRRG